MFLPTFRWRGLATTNYDRLIEDSYASVKSPLQRLVPTLSNSDQVWERLKSSDSLHFLKLHGCITRTTDPSLPLILTPDQYVTHRTNRSRPFNTLQEWAYESPIIFVGHSLQDADIRQILLELAGMVEWRPRFYLLKPDVVPEEVAFWEGKRITVLPGTFDELMTSLDKAIPANLRIVSALLPPQDHPIASHFATREAVPQSVIDYLQLDADYVFPGMPTGAGTPSNFYRGFDLGWYPIANGLDVRRKLTDVLLSDVIIRADTDRPSSSDLYAIRAEAGAGKTVLLRRVAWEAAADFGVVCLYADPSSGLPAEPIREIHRLTRKRIFLFVDNAADKVADLRRLLENAKGQNLSLTVLTAERANAWTMFCEELDEYLTDSFDLRYLSHDEIGELVDLLARHDSLGEYLPSLSREDRIRSFAERAGRQLLVALHEATLGRPFEEILLDEYNEIRPLGAQSLYLTVCALNRFSVPVRAGLISRVHGISFDQFRSEFLGPLEHVVKAHQESSGVDYTYAARHPHVAQIVFEQVLRNPDDRYHQYALIIDKLNLSYSSDTTSFRAMLRAWSMYELFPRIADARGIYELALRVAPRDPYVLQHMANYERIHPEGDHEKALEALREARRLAPRDSTIIHSLAELTRTRANAAEHPLLRGRLRSDARELLVHLLTQRPEDRYARHTLAKVTLDELEDLLREEAISEPAVEGAIRAVEAELGRGLQRAPDDGRLLTTEAEFRRLVKENEKALAALKRAHRADPRDPFIATRLSRTYEDLEDLAAARDCLREALEARPADKSLQLRFATLLRKEEPQDRGALLHHYRRAFSRGDRNYEAQFWYGRFAFESEDEVTRNEAGDIFQRLRNEPIPYAERVRVRDRSAASDGHAMEYMGTVRRKEETFGFVEVDGRGEEIFFHRDQTPPGLWDVLKPGQRVVFGMGYTFGGPVAENLRAR